MKSKHAAEARVILGGGIDVNGKLSEACMSRVKYALGLYGNHRLPFVVTGRWGLMTDVRPAATEAAAMRSYLIRHAVPPSEIFAEDESMDTIGNAYFTYERFIKPKGWHSVEVITSEFHVPRAQYVFDKVLGKTCSIKVIASPDSDLTASKLAELKDHEQKIFAFTHTLLDSAPVGDTTAIHQILLQLPGYSSTPKYSKEALQRMLGGK